MYLLLSQILLIQFLGSEVHADVHVNLFKLDIDANNTFKTCPSGGRHHKGCPNYYSPYESEPYECECGRSQKFEQAQTWLNDVGCGYKGE